MTFTMDKMADLYNQRSRALASLKELDRQAGKREWSREEERKAARIEAEIDIADEQIKAGLSERQNASIRKMKDEVLGFGGGESGVRAETLSRSIGELLQVGSRNEGTFTLDLDETAIYEKRDLLTTTAGASVITDFAKDLEVIKSQGSPIWERARKITTDHTRSIQYPAISAHGSAVFLAEAGIIQENDPTLATFTLDAWKVGQAMQVSTEAEFELAGVLDIVAKDMVANIATAVDVQLHGGDGTTEPQGLVVGFTGSSTATGVVAPTADNLIDAVYDIPAFYRQSGRFFWVFNDTVWAAVRKLKDSTGQYLWQPGLSMGQPDMLLGHPIYVDSNFAAVGANAKIGAFYDADKFLVRSTPMRLERSVDYAFLNDVVTWRALTSVDAQVLDVAAGTIITNEAA